MLNCNVAIEVEPDCLMCIDMPYTGAIQPEVMRDPCFNTHVVSGIFAYLHSGCIQSILPYGNNTNLDDYERAAGILCLNGLKENITKLHKYLELKPSAVKHFIRTDSKPAMLVVNTWLKYHDEKKLRGLGMEAWMRETNLTRECEIPLLTVDLDSSKDWHEATRDMDVDLGIEERFLDHYANDKCLVTDEAYKKYLADPRTQRGNPYHFALPFMWNNGWDSAIGPALFAAFQCKENTDLTCKVMSAIAKLPPTDKERVKAKLMMNVTEHVRKKCLIGYSTAEALAIDHAIKDFYGYYFKY